MVYRLKRRGNGSEDEIAADVRRVAQLLGRPTVTQREYAEHGEFTVNWVVMVNGSWNEALKKAGCGISQRKWTSDDCLKSIKAVWDKLGSQPYTTDYENLASQLGLPCISTVEQHLGSWSRALLAFKVSPYAQNSSDHPEDRSQEATPSVDRRLNPVHACGKPTGYERMIYAPVNEMGVLALFAMLAQELGFIIECIGAAFPDCTAKRFDLKTGRHVPVLIELEFKSSGFVRHKHPEDGCNLIICWTHDWRECPSNIEVISLKDHLQARGRREAL